MGKSNKGKNHKKGGNVRFSRETVFKSDGQVYGQVINMHGGSLLKVHCFDGHTRIGHIRGKLRKKVWINVGDILLLSIREFQNMKADVLLKYTPEEVKELKAAKEIPDKINIFTDNEDVVINGWNNVKFADEDDTDEDISDNDSDLNSDDYVKDESLDSLEDEINKI